MSEALAHRFLGPAAHTRARPKCSRRRIRHRPFGRVRAPTLRLVKIVRVELGAVERDVPTLGAPGSIAIHEDGSCGRRSVTQALGYLVRFRESRLCRAERRRVDHVVGVGCRRCCKHRPNGGSSGTGSQMHPEPRGDAEHFDEPDQRAVVGKDADDVGTQADRLVQPLERIRAAQLASVRAWGRGNLVSCTSIGGCWRTSLACGAPGSN